jgi:hypothetical protein
MRQWCKRFPCLAQVLEKKIKPTAGRPTIFDTLEIDDLYIVILSVRSIGMQFMAYDLDFELVIRRFNKQENKNKKN